MDTLNLSLTRLNIGISWNGFEVDIGIEQVFKHVPHDINDSMIHIPLTKLQMCLVCPNYAPSVYRFPVKKPAKFLFVMFNKKKQFLMLVFNSSNLQMETKGEDDSNV